jgi:hypothetical protein
LDAVDAVDAADARGAVAATDAPGTGPAGAANPEDYGERQVSERSIRRVVRAASRTKPAGSG